MKSMSTFGRQHGATLVVGLIMLVLITLMVSTAFMLSTTNLKSVGNMQSREEALAAANSAIEQVISSPTIFVTPQARTVQVSPYSVTVAAPVCLYATEVATEISNDANPNVHSEGSGGVAKKGVPGYLDTYWDITASVNDTVSNARVVAHQGIKIALPEDPNPCP